MLAVSLKFKIPDPVPVRAREKCCKLFFHLFIYPSKANFAW